jgi:hypothetical protein
VGEPDEQPLPVVLGSVPCWLGTVRWWGGIRGTHTVAVFAKARYGSNDRLGGGGVARAAGTASPAATPFWAIPATPPGHVSTFRFTPLPASAIRRVPRMICLVGPSRRLRCCLRLRSVLALLPAYGVMRSICVAPNRSPESTSRRGHVLHPRAHARQRRARGLARVQSLGGAHALPLRAPGPRGRGLQEGAARPRPEPGPGWVSGARACCVLM